MPSERETYSHHVVTFHVWLVFILALVVELSEEVEGHHRVEIDHDCQQAHRQYQLERDRTGLPTRCLLTHVAGNT